MDRETKASTAAGQLRSSWVEDRTGRQVGEVCGTVAHGGQCCLHTGGVGHRAAGWNGDHGSPGFSHMVGDAECSGHESWKDTELQSKDWVLYPEAMM